MIASLASNRVRPELRDYVGPLAQDALMAADLDVSTFDEAIRRFRTASLTGYQHSRFDSTALWKVIETVNAERGVNFARDCVFNDMSGVTVWHRARAVRRDRVRLAARRLAPRPSRALGQPAGGRGGGPDVLDRPPGHDAYGGGGLRDGLVKLLIRAGNRIVHLSDVLAIAGVAPVEYGPGWIHIDCLLGEPRRGRAAGR